MNLTTATPVEIDTAIDAVNKRIQSARVEAHQAIRSLGYLVANYHEVEQMTDGDVLAAADTAIANGHYAAKRLSTLKADYAARIEKIDGLVVEVRPYGEEFRRRGGWTRAFLALSSDGHVHNGTECSTCNRGNEPTQFQWMTEYSGKPEAEIVADAGWRACSTCYPTAPVGDEASLPTKMFSDADKAKAEAKAEREAKAAKRLADRVAKGLTADGSEFRCEWVERDAPGWERDPETRQQVHVHRDRVRTERFKTEKAAIMWYVQQHAWGAYRLQDMAPAFAAIEDAIAAKHGQSVDEVRAMLTEKIAAKKKRDERA